jgi:membrane protein YqaA with SNARE-associated domain
MEDTDASRLRRLKTLAWFRKKVVPLLGLILALGIMLGIGYVYWRYPGIFRELQALGYLGAFLVSLILNATIILPVSNVAVIVALGGTLPIPAFVGLAGGIGAGIGEMTGYIAGRSGRRLFARSRIYTHVEGWVKKWGWIAVFVLSAFPVAFDIVGIIAGALRMPLWRFFVACWAGRTISYIVVAYFGQAIIGYIPWFT